MSAPDTDPTCPGEPDADCSHAFGAVGDGIGRNLLINANLIMGNAAEAGSGGGLRFQGVNGAEVGTFPNNPERWYSVNVTNNIITNNVAGWDGGGVSLQDSLAVNLINNTIVSNDSTASSGSLFGAFFAPEASAPTTCPLDPLPPHAQLRCVPLSDPQPAGLSSAGHTVEFLASLPANITCPTGHGVGGTGSGGRTNGACRRVSFPILYNDVLWQNRAFNIVVTQPASGAQQATVALVPPLNQASTGQCVAPPSALNYWDIGLRGDTGPNNHSSGVTFTPQASVLTSIAGYAGGGTGFRPNSASFSPGVVSQYCNGSKRPPEAGATGWFNVPPGTNESNVPIPVFSLTAGATVDEGNNWVNISWGPLSMTSPSTGLVLGDYSLAAGSPAIGYITNANSSTTYAAAPLDDFFGNLRKSNNAVDAGAVEFAGATAAAPTLASIAPSSARRGQAVSVTLTGTNLTGATAVTVSGTAANAIAVSNLVVVNDTTITATFTIQAGAAITGANATHAVSVQTPGGTSNTVSFTVFGPAVASITPASGKRGTTVPVTITGTGLNGATSVTAPPPAGGGPNGLTISAPVVNAAGTQLTVNVTISGTAGLSTRNVRVATPGGTTPVNAAVTFTVTP